MAERLDFKTKSTPYESMLAAEHIVRYVIASRFCSGKKVLDIACGEGYGAAFMADHGARSVLGVDVSDLAIANAGLSFSRKNVSFVHADAGDTHIWNPNSEKFDLIVCYETIEHVSSASSLLTVLRDCLAENGIILISCPYDLIEHEEGISNPFHTGLYSFEDFKSITTPILGEASQWLLGGPLNGMAVFDASSYLTGTEDDSIWNMLNLQEAESAKLLPAQISHKIEPDGATFYLGIWNGVINNSMVAAPMSRRAYLGYYFSNLQLKKNYQTILHTKNENEKIISALESRISAIKRISNLHMEYYKEKLSPLNLENKKIRSENEALRSQIIELSNTVSSHSNSRAHRIAELYTRTATGRGPIRRTIRFAFAASLSVIRAVKRRIKKVGIGHRK